MHIHLIAIGGSIMHNLAIALHKKGYRVSGSDDEIFNPAHDRLSAYSLLPKYKGWNTAVIDQKPDAVILGMHAKADNPELKRAMELNLPIYSFPEYIYQQTSDKLRVSIGGSHGKTTITSMVLHVLKQAGKQFDYLVGAQLSGFETMVGLSKDAPMAIFEGDEYLTSALDPRPKFLWYKPQIALLSGIAWDHINVFPTWENYVKQFADFLDSLENKAVLCYYRGDETLAQLIEKHRERLKLEPYNSHPHEIDRSGNSCLITPDGKISLSVFGQHNMQNINGARLVCKHLGVSDTQFYTAIDGFTGAAKRMQLLAERGTRKIYLDFAHSPSKVQATTRAVKQQYAGKKLLCIFELHTYSSLSKDFLPQYAHSLQAADSAAVFFDPHALALKKLPAINKQDISDGFSDQHITPLQGRAELEQFLYQQATDFDVIVFMSSGNFGGLDLKQWTQTLPKQ